MTVACSQQLVRAYSELRQFEQLLGSLLNSLQLAACSAAAVIGPEPGTGVRGEGAGNAQRESAAASLLVSHPHVLASLQAAVRALPPGMIV